jgi:tRNA(fMet)-specific endonuclease VapC
LTELLAAVTVLPFGATEAQQAARIRAELERAGEPIGPYDILIAATALAHGGRLATRNVKEFGRVPGLSLEDWY